VSAVEQHQDDPRAEAWGLARFAPPGVATWGARTIPESPRPAELVRGTRRVRRPAVPARMNLLWDRQGAVDGSPAERKALCDRLNAGGMELAQARYAELERAGGLEQDKIVDLVRDGGLVILARACGGYVYLGAWLEVDG